MRRAALLLALLGASALRAQPTAFPDTLLADTLRLDQLQLIGTHNSYKAPIAPSLVQLMEADAPGSTRALDYSHPPLTEQLDRGLRVFELDVVHDPTGGRFADPVGPRLVAAQGLPAGPPVDPDGVLGEPGFKVLHVPDVDFRTTCLTLAACLAEMAAWSDAHPRHVPLFITVNAKDGVVEGPGFTRPLPFTVGALDSLDAAFRAGLGPRLLAPDDLRGEAESLEAAVLTTGWPTLGDTRGRFVVILDEGGAKLGRFRQDHPGLRGRALFANAAPGTPEAAIRILNDPVAQAAEIRTLVAAGYLVRTRADAGTEEARSGETARRQAAFRSGAHLIKTDYPVPDERFGTGYRVVFPSGTYQRANPVTTASEVDG